MKELKSNTFTRNGDIAIEKSVKQDLFNTSKVLSVDLGKTVQEKCKPVYQKLDVYYPVNKSEIIRPNIVFRVAGITRRSDVGLLNKFYKGDNAFNWKDPLFKSEFKHYKVDALSLGFGGKLFVKFKNPIALITTHEIFRIYEFDKGEPHILRFGNSLTFKGTEITDLSQVDNTNNASIKPHEVTVGGEFILKFWKNSRHLPHGYWEKNPGNQIIKFSWVEIIDNVPDNKKEKDLKNYPGLDITNIIGFKSNLKILTILLDISGSMSDGESNGLYRSGRTPYHTKMQSKKPITPPHERLYYRAITAIKNTLNNLNFDYHTLFLFDGKNGVTKVRDNNNKSEFKKLYFKKVLENLRKEIEIGTPRFEFHSGTPLKSALITGAKDLIKLDPECGTLLVITDGGGEKEEDFTSFRNLPQPSNNNFNVIFIGFKLHLPPNSKQPFENYKRKFLSQSFTKWNTSNVLVCKESQLKRVLYQIK